MKENKREFVNKITMELEKFSDEKRKRIKQLIIKQLIVFTIGYFASKGCLLVNHPVFSVFCMSVVLFSCIAFFYNFPDDNKEFKKFLKKKCKAQILKEFDLETLNGKPIPDDIVKKSNLFPLYSKTETDDVFEGVYKDTKFKVVETRLIAKRKNNEIDAFKGVILVLNANKKIESETLVTSKGDRNIRNLPPCLNSILGFLIGGLLLTSISCTVIPLFLILRDSMFSTVKPHFAFSIEDIMVLIPSLILIGALGIYIYKQIKKMQKATLEDVNFEKSFDVYTKDQVEARYILTPTFMERLKSLNTSFGTKGVKCSFFDDYIMIAIPTKKDLFELGSLYQSLGSNKLVEEFYDELHSIYDMIDHLKLNEKIGL